MPAKGKIVLFLRGDRPTAGVVDGEKNGRPIVVAPDGKRLQAPAVLAVGPDASGQAREAAKAWDRRLAEAAAAVPVPEIWELLEGSDAMTTAQIEESWFGSEAGFEDRAALIAALLGDRTYFTRRKELLTPEPRRRVEERLARQADHERKAARIEALSAAAEAVSRGSTDRGGVGEEDWSGFIEGLRQLSVHGPEAKGTGEAAEILRRAGLNVMHAPFDLLVALGEFDPDENLDLIRFGVRDGFPDEVTAETREVLGALEAGAWREGREDATGLGAVTVDSERTLEVDDALSIRTKDDGWEIGVHIADAAALIERDGAIHREALVRGASLYMPEGAIPMIPRELGRGGFSLDEGVDRPALSLFASIGRDGTLGQWRFARTVLRVARRLSYAQADELVGGGDPVLAPLATAGRLLRDRRIDAGGVDLRLPELTVRVEDGEIQVSVSRAFTSSHVLVSECAILYNGLAAKLLADSGVAGIFRSQAAPEGDLPDTEAGGPEVELAARRLLSPSATTTEPGRHFTLGLDAYVLATSPIRRSFDLLVQGQVAAAAGSGGALAREELDRALLTAAPGAEAVTQIERARARYWLLRYLDLHVRGTLVSGIVVDHQSDRILVHLPDYALEIPLRTKEPRAFRLGEEIEVRLDRADARRDILRISLVR
jgi:exoribonuclease-2